MNHQLDSIMNGKKIKYVVLDELLKDFTNDNYNQCNIYIDLNSILSGFYNEKFIDEFNSLPTNDQYIFCTQILNIAGHFRHYFYSRKFMYTNIYFIYSNTRSTYTNSVLPNYKKEYYKRFTNTNFHTMNKIFNKNIKVVNLITKYIPHIYFVDTGNVDPYVGIHHFLNSNPDQFNLIYTTDKLMYNHVLSTDNTYILTHKSDSSRVIGKEKIFDTILNKKYREDETFEIKFDTGLYPLIFGVAGSKTHGIDGIAGYGNIKIIKALNKEFEDGNGIITKETFFKLFKDEDYLDKIFSILDINNHYNKSVVELDNTFRLDNSIEDLIDGETLRYINDEYLNHYPIYLEYLFEGEEYE